MIVRDESRLLQACLDSVRDVVDQIVIVDTGSEDDTVDIAARAGAEVVHHRWRDDFSAARNEAVVHARGSFVLILDADERLTAEGAAAIRDATAHATADCYLLPLHNADALCAPAHEVVDGTRRIGGETYLPRLLRRTPDLRWEGAVHEHVRRWLAHGARRSALLEAPIVHYGYVEEIRSAKDKDARNRRLLQLRCDTDPDDPDPRIYLARELRGAGDHAGALRLALEAWALCRARGRADRLRPIGASLVSTALALLAGQSPPLDALPYAQEAIDWGHTHPEALFFCGVTFERAAEVEARTEHLRAALDCYRRASAWRGTATFPVDPDLMASSLPLRAGIVLCKLGAHEEALVRLAAARPTPADVTPVRIAFAEALSGAQRHDEALQILDPILEAGTSDPWWVGAQIVWDLGHTRDAIAFLQHASQLGDATESHRQQRGRRLAAEIQRELATGENA